MKFFIITFILIYIVPYLRGTYISKMKLMMTKYDIVRK